MTELLKTIPAALLTFAGTTLDDIFVVTVIFAGAHTIADKRRIVLGEYLGIMATFSLGVLGALTANLLPERFIGLLGLMPIAIGVKEIVETCLHKEGEDHVKIKSIGVLGVALISLSNGGDNIGVYVPLFATYTVPQILLTGGVFLLCIALFCFVAERIGSLPSIKHFILRYKHILVPAILILLGVYILLESYVFGG